MGDTRLRCATFIRDGIAFRVAFDIHNPCKPLSLETNRQVKQTEVKCGAETVMHTIVFGEVNILTITEM